MDITKEVFLEKIERDGLYLCKNVFDVHFVERAKSELMVAIQKENNYHKDSFHQDYGMVLLCCKYGGIFLEVLEHPDLVEPFHWLMGKGCIVYSQTSTSMPPFKGNYSSRIHVDSPRIIPNYISSFMALMLLDDFNAENGATWFLPGSHNSTEQPSSEYFYSNAKRLIAPAGSILFWHPRIWHAGGKNQTKIWRHAMTVVMCRPYMKQRIDIPRALETTNLSNVSDKIKQKLGIYAQVPSNYEEYYAPAHLRKFKQETE